MTKLLLIDRQTVNPQACEGVRPMVAVPQKDAANPLFVQDKPWEIRIDNGYPNVLFDPETGLFHCYYTLFVEDEDTENTPQSERARRPYKPLPSRVTALAYACSEDGVTWEKPELNRVKWRGSKANNLVFRYVHGAGVMIDDHDDNPDRRFKLVAKIDVPGRGTGMAVAFSPDGRTWSDLIAWEGDPFAADSHNCPYWDARAGLYRLTTRVWRDGVRVSVQCESDDFIHWSAPEPALRGEGFERQVYAMPVSPVAGGFLGLASVYREGDRADADFDTVSLEATWSNDGAQFDFAAPGCALVPHGAGAYPDGAFDSACVYASPLVRDGEGRLWLYYMGGNGRHTNWRESALGRARLHDDAFVGYAPAARSGRFVSAELAFDGSDVRLLVSRASEAAGACSLRVAVRPRWHEPAFEGFDERPATDLDAALAHNAPTWISLASVFAGANTGANVTSLANLDPNALATLAGARGCIDLELEGVCVWAIDGGVTLGAHRLWEGADATALNPLSPRDFAACADAQSTPSARAKRTAKHAPRATNAAVHKSMQGNKRANTKPELVVRERLCEAGLTGYRLQWKVPGRPDIAWPGKKVALFVNGCFWHRCPHCNPSMPKRHVEYWLVKFEGNVERDKRNLAELEAAGWKVHVIWECQLKKDAIDETMANLLPELASELDKPLNVDAPADSAPAESESA